MELNSPIYDFNFQPGDRAQYTYIDSHGEENTIIVRIVNYKIYQDGKIYTISAHQTALDKAGLVGDSALSNHYFNDIPCEHKVVLIDPDELDPFYTQLSVVVNNTRGNKND